jgi:putative addiction module component (TIGR02574 family)
MSKLYSELGIDKLSVEQRLQLLEDIWDGLDGEAPFPPLTPAQEAELGRRIADFEANPNIGSSWEEVKARLAADK